NRLVRMATDFRSHPTAPHATVKQMRKSQRNYRCIHPNFRVYLGPISSRRGRSSVMARHKAVATIQLNLRVTPSVYRQLESRAQARGITISEVVRQLLDQSLGSYINNFEQRVRDAVERSARGSRDPEPIFRRLATLGATLRHL